jgi:hypothetical protein
LWFVNERFLDKSFVGRVIDQDFINDLPENVDVCGETANFILSLLMDPIPNSFRNRRSRIP